MSGFTMVVIGDTEVVARIKALPGRLHDRLVTRIVRLSVQLQAKVKTDKLSGQVLHRRTGTLSRSINRKLLVNTPMEIIASVGTNVSYARPHEFGGTFTVPAHTRTQTQVFGRPINPVLVNVRAHKVTFPERSFLRSALREMQPEIEAGVKAEVAAVVA